MPQFRKGSSSFGEFVDNNDFSDVALACEDGHLVEAHKVILAGSGPQTTIHTSWFQLGGGCLSSKLKKEREGFWKFAEQSRVQTIRMMMTMMAQVTQQKGHKRAK